MIESLGAKRQVCCDHCSGSYPMTYDHGDFDVMISDAKAAGWKFQKVGPVWTHTCPDHEKPKQGSLL